MSRLIFVPQYPTKMRYQEFFFTEFPKQLNKYFDEIIVLGMGFKDIENSENIIDKSMFSPINSAIEFEQYQIIEFLKLKLRWDDILLMMDFSFPGFFANVLYHKKPTIKVFAYCHATSLNTLDYFEEFRDSKFQCETGFSKLFTKVFVGSKYHQDKLKWGNTEIVGLPVPPFQTFREEKIYDIISVSRPNIQKINKSIESKIERDFSEIKRKVCSTWEEYYKFLSQSKVLLITSREDTFNYSIMEAIMNGTVVIAPCRLAFPELLPREFLYDDYEELKEILWWNLKENKPPKALICQNMCNNFYENIASTMRTK